MCVPGHIRGILGSEADPQSRDPEVPKEPAIPCRISSIFYLPRRSVGLRPVLVVETAGVSDDDWRTVDSRHDLRALLCTPEPTEKDRIGQRPARDFGFRGERPTRSS